MLELLYILKAVSIFVKDDCHYAFKGVNFKPLHEWADEINEPLSDFIDEIKESYLLRKEIAVPRGSEINAKATEFIPKEIGDSNAAILANIRALLEMANRAADSAKGDTAGDSDLLGRIGSHLQKHIGLLNLALGE